MVEKEQRALAASLICQYGVRCAAHAFAQVIEDRVNRGHRVLYGPGTGNDLDKAEDW